MYKKNENKYGFVILYWVYTYHIINIIYSLAYFGYFIMRMLSATIHCYIIIILLLIIHHPNNNNNNTSTINHHTINKSSNDWIANVNVSSSPQVSPRPRPALTWRDQRRFAKQNEHGIVDNGAAATAFRGELAAFRVGSKRHTNATAANTLPWQ